MKREGFAYFLAMQQKLSALLENVSLAFTQADTALIAEFIGANEIGLALEAMIDLLVASPIRLKPAVTEKAAELATEMNLLPMVADRLRLLRERGGPDDRPGLGS
jgi:hypothetical protein